MLNIQDLAHYAQNSAQNLGIKQYDIYGSSVEEAGVEVSFGE
jgi:PmbA protein